jgi:hypothetical protein
MSTSRNTIAALDHLESALRRSLEDMQNLLVRVEQLRDNLQSGRTLSEVVDVAARPLIIESLTALLDRLGDASSALRRAEAQQLFDEGFTRTRIAATFGVSRQRATTLLARGHRGRQSPRQRGGSG